MFAASRQKTVNKVLNLVLRVTHTNDNQKPTSFNSPFICYFLLVFHPLQNNTPYLDSSRAFIFMDSVNKNSTDSFDFMKLQVANWKYLRFSHAGQIQVFCNIIFVVFLKWTRESTRNKKVKTNSFKANCEQTVMHKNK